MSQKRRAARRKIKKTPIIGLFCLGALITVSLIATIYLIFLRPGTIHYQNKQPSPPAKSQALNTKRPLKSAPAAPATVQESPPPKPTARPRVALIIDDIGYRRKIAEQLLDLDLNINFSILPHSPAGQDLAQKAHAAGHDVLLHLPMEPTLNKWDPGPGALFLKMGKEELRQTIMADLQTVPQAIGVNNHMGSLFTEHADAMRIFLGEIQAHKLFFVDSFTSSKSVGYELAKGMSIKTAKRDVFIDNDQDTDKIIEQLKILIAIAAKHGQAIGIGHPYQETLQALIAARPLLTDSVSLVPIHEIVQ